MVKNTEETGSIANGWAVGRSHWNSGELGPSPNCGINHMTLGRFPNLTTLKFISSQMRCFRISISYVPIVL